MTELKYFAPGTAGGGEHGAMRRVLVKDLRGKHLESPPPRWISDPGARNRLGELLLPARDRFLIDLLTTSGIRVGEALSLFVADLHFGGGSQQLGCPHADPHFHVRVDNPVENSARAKGGPRTLFVHRDVVESYIDYALERRKILRARRVCDASPHVFITLYSEDRWLGRSMTYSSVKRLLKLLKPNRLRPQWSTHVAPHVRHTLDPRRRLRPCLARCRAGVTWPSCTELDAGLHPLRFPPKGGQGFMRLGWPRPVIVHRRWG